MVDTLWGVGHWGGTECGNTFCPQTISLYMILLQMPIVQSSYLYCSIRLVFCLFLKKIHIYILLNVFKVLFIGNISSIHWLWNQKSLISCHKNSIGHKFCYFTEVNESYSLLLKEKISWEKIQVTIVSLGCANHIGRELRKWWGRNVYKASIKFTTEVQTWG